jgi:hypothetical protein
MNLIIVLTLKMMMMMIMMKMMMKKMKVSVIKHFLFVFCFYHFDYLLFQRFHFEDLDNGFLSFFLVENSVRYLAHGLTNPRTSIPPYSGRPISQSFFLLCMDWSNRWMALGGFEFCEFC